MNIEAIKTIVREQEEELRRLFLSKRIIEREINIPLDSNITVITGVRRAGKTTLAHLLLSKKEYCYINFDDERLYGLEASELNDVLEAFYQLYDSVEYIILDEPQNVEGWELFVNRLGRSKKVIVTGSNANLLSKELSTRLTGRYIDFVLYPFSFSEYLKYLDFKPDFYLTEVIAKTKNHLSDYTKKGGFPEALSLGKRFLLRLYDDIINKDILARYGVRYIKALKELGKFVLSNFSSEISYNSLREFLKVKSVHTVKNYLGYLENAYLVFLIEKFSYSIKDRTKAPRKIYLVDTGIGNLGFRFTEDRGKFIENLVAIELKREKEKNPLLEIYYWKSYSGKEVDFVLKEGRKIVSLLQVSYDITNPKTRKREISALLKASAELKCKNLILINWDYEGEEDIKGEKICFLPLWKWLLSHRVH